MSSLPWIVAPVAEPFQKLARETHLIHNDPVPLKFTFVGNANSVAAQAAIGKAAASQA